MQSPITDIYLFLNYSKSVNSFAKLIANPSSDWKVHDGFQSPTIPPQGALAIVDELTKDNILFKLAQNNIPLVGVSDAPLHPLVQQLIPPDASFENLRDIICVVERNQDACDIHIDNLLPGQTDIWNYVKEIVIKSAQTGCSVLLHGESGTGKELVAKAVHLLSHRNKEPFVPVNCGAIPLELIESELFGHEKGSFTGAIASRTGKFEQVGSGTLFLDEIGDMPFSMQVKLLRVLQEKIFEKVGSNKHVSFNARLVSATHQSLSHLVQENKFREDLFYRLNVLPIQLPALRERLSDLPIIFESLKKKENWSFELSNSAYKTLKTLPWPGNIRQFYNLMARAEVFFPNKEIKGSHIDKLLCCETFTMTKTA